MSNPADRATCAFTYGSNQIAAAIAGLTVTEAIAQVRQEHGEELNLPANLGNTLVNGAAAGDDYVLAENDRVEVLKPSGVKGV